MLDEEIKIYDDKTRTSEVDDEGQPTDIIERVALSLAIGDRSLPEALKASWNFAIEAFMVKYIEIQEQDLTKLVDLNEVHKAVTR